jgi:hypothetical protein
LEVSTGIAVFRPIWRALWAPRSGHRIAETILGQLPSERTGKVSKPRFSGWKFGWAGPDEHGKPLRLRRISATSSRVCGRSFAMFSESREVCVDLPSCPVAVR